MVDIRHFEYFVGSGNPVSGAVIQIKVASLTQPNPNAVIASTTSNANGMWQVLGLASGDYDVLVTYSGRVRKRFGLAVNPLGFDLTDSDIAVGAAISLAKLHSGTGVVNDVGPLNLTPANFSETVSNIIFRIKSIHGGVSWTTAPATTIDALNTLTTNLYNAVSTITGYFHQTTGHKHLGAVQGDAPQLDNAAIATGAAIDQTKLAAGTLDENVTPDNTAANLQERLSDIVSLVKDIVGGTNWYSAPANTIAAINSALTTVTSTANSALSTANAAWAKFHASTGHTHTGGADNAPKIGTSGIADNVTLTNPTVNTALTLGPGAYVDWQDADAVKQYFYGANVRRGVAATGAILYDMVGPSSFWALYHSGQTPGSDPARFYVDVTAGKAYAAGSEVLSKATLRPLVKAYRSTTQAINSTTADVSFDVELYDTDGMYNPAVPGRFTATTPGYYRFTTRVYAISVPNVSVGGFMHNNTTLHQFWVTPTGGDAAIINGTTIISMAAADFVTVRFTTTAAVNFATSNLGWFEAEWLGPL